MTRENGYIKSFYHKRFGNCTAEFYPSGTAGRSATPTMLDFPRGVITSIDPVAAEFSDLPIGMSEIPETKIKLRLDKLPEDFREWINEPDSVQVIDFGGLFPDIEIITRNLWIIRADFHLGGLGTVIFIGVQQEENEAEAKVKRGTVEKELVLVPFIADFCQRKATDSILTALWNNEDNELRQPTYGVDFKHTDVIPKVEKTFTSEPINWPVKKGNWNLGKPKFFQVMNIFSEIAALLDNEFAYISRGLSGFDFRCENPYKYIKFFKQTLEYLNPKGAELPEANLWFIAAYGTFEARLGSSGDLYSGFFRRKGMEIKNIWDLLKYCAESCGLKGMVRADEIAFQPIFSYGYISSAIATAKTDFKSDAEITEGYHVLRSVVNEKLDGHASYDIQKVKAQGAVTDGDDWPIGRAPFTNAPCMNQTGGYARSSASPKTYYINTPWPENRLYYFENPEDALCYRVHDHCIIPASDVSGDDSEAHGAPEYQWPSLPIHHDTDSFVYNEFFGLISSIQANSTLAVIVTKFLYSLFSKSNQALLKASYLNGRRGNPNYIGQRYLIDVGEFAPDQLGEIGGTAFLMKAEAPLNGKPGEVIKSEFFIRG